MIQKIQINEYLKRVDNMGAAEKDEYMNRVGEWLDRQAPLLALKADDDSARFQNAIQCSAGWNDEECRAWTDGARLMTALAAKTDTWLPDMLYVKSAKRAIRQMVSVVSSFKIQVSGDRDGIAGQQAKQVAKGTQAVDTFQDAGNGGVAGGDKDGEAQVSPTPVRPKHIDQYVHLLPQKTQEKAATVKGLLREMDVAREKLTLLIDDPKSSADSRATWSKTVTNIDSKLKAIYKELDDEWDKLVQAGRVTVDDLGNAHVIESVAQEPATEQEAGTDADKEGEKDQQAENAKQAALLRKFLIDKRNAKTDAQKDKWLAKYQEMVKLGGEASVTDKVREAAEYYGIELDGDTAEHADAQKPDGEGGE